MYLEGLAYHSWNVGFILSVMGNQRRVLHRKVTGTALQFALGRPRGMEWGGRREEGSGWGTHVYLWRIHFDIWQN